MSDVVATIQYIAAVQLLGLAALPLSLRLFNKLPDRGWALSKILGILLSAWSVWLLSSLKLVPFDRISSLIIIGSIATIIWLLFFRKELIRQLKAAFWFIVIEEILFIGFIAFWTYLRGWSPDINGLEKFMDYGFMLSAMKTEYFPPIDHFLARESINYYYFGHYIAGFITMIANVPASMGYNLQMSLIFGLAVIESFAIGAGLFYLSVKEELIRVPWRSWLAGTLTFLFITLFGNLHTAVYYFIDRTTYWYPDATRFIENTIHEFPIYSFIVNDLHGHVSDIPVVFLVIATLLMVLLLPFEKRKFIVNEPKSIANRRLLYLFFLSFVIGTMYATNAWDYAIYLVLS
jgi:YYY domain-containing protein